MNARLKLQSHTAETAALDEAEEMITSTDGVTTNALLDPCVCKITDPFKPSVISD